MKSLSYSADRLFTAPGEIGASGFNQGRPIAPEGSEPVKRDADGIPIDPHYEASDIPEHRIEFYRYKLRHE